MAGIDPIQDALCEMQRDIMTGRMAPPVSLRDVDPSLPPQTIMAYLSAGLTPPASPARPPAFGHAAANVWHYTTPTVPVQVSLEHMLHPSDAAGLQAVPPGAVGAHDLQVNADVCTSSSGGGSTSGGNGPGGRT